MKQEGLLFFTDTWLTLIGLVLFFGFFVVMLIKVKMIKKEYYEYMSNMPLTEETGNERRL